MERSHWIKAGIGLGTLLMTLSLGCTTKRQTAPQITDTWTEAAKRAETAAGRAEAAASRVETAAARAEAAAKRLDDVVVQIEARTIERLRK